MSASHNSLSEGGLAGAIERGQAARRAWLREGVVLSSADFAARLRVTPDELASLRSRGELLSVDVDGEACWPAVLLRLPLEQASLLCRSLTGCDDVAKLMFVIRRHGALGGQTVAEAAAQGRLAEVLRLAASWHGAKTTR